MTITQIDPICKFTAIIEEIDGRHVVEIPRSELEFGTISAGEICSISIQKRQHDSSRQTHVPNETEGVQAPVSIGEQRTVTIDDIGAKGDGIARVERGYVLIIPGTEPGDEVMIEVTDVKPNVAFATVVDKDQSIPQEHSK